MRWTFANTNIEHCHSFGREPDKYIHHRHRMLQRSVGIYCRCRKQNTCDAVRKDAKVGAGPDGWRDAGEICVWSLRALPIIALLSVRLSFLCISTAYTKLYSTLQRFGLLSHRMSSWLHYRCCFSSLAMRRTHEKYVHSTGVTM